MKKKEQFKIYIAAYLVLKKGNKILLSRRANTGYQDGKYSMVAGHLDGNETARHCIIREAMEEAGIILDPGDVRVVHIMHRSNPDREYIDIYLTASKWDGEIKIMEPELCDDISWFSVNKLPKNILPEVKFALEKIREKEFYGEFGW